MIAYALRCTLPVALGYLPIGFAFGVLLNQLGIAWGYAPAMALLVYAGAAQFMVIGLLRTNAPLLDFLVLTLALNVRHVFYGLSFLDRYLPLSARNVYLVGALTDETYSLLTSVADPPGDPRQFALLVSALNHFYWVVGCTLGAVVGSVFRFKAPELEFVLPCLFIVLAVEQVRSKRRYDLGVAAALATVVSIWATGNGALLAAIALSIGILALAGRRVRWRL